MSWRNKYVWNFLHHVPKTQLLKAAIEAGIDIPVDATKHELKLVWRKVLKH
jgi:hypothetical protein